MHISMSKLVGRKDRSAQLLSKLAEDHPIAQQSFDDEIKDELATAMSRVTLVQTAKAAPANGASHK